MRVTIIVPDNTILVDGVGATVDCTALDVDTHAVQWYDTYGEVEFKNTFDEETKTLRRDPNEVITDFSAYQPYVEEWVLARAEELAKEKAKQDEYDAQIEALKKAAEEEEEEARKRRAEVDALPPPKDIVFEHENRLRKLEGKKPITLKQLQKYVWGERLNEDGSLK